MIKRIFLGIAFIAVAVWANGQQNKKSLLYEFANPKHENKPSFANTSLFGKAEKTTLSANISSNIVSRATSLVLDKTAAKQTFTNKPAGITLSIPFVDRNYSLVLAEQKITSPGSFSFGTLEKNYEHKKIATNEGLHYRGYIDGDPSSLACISIFENGDVMGLFSNSEGNFNIGKMSGSDSNYIVYSNKDVLAAPHYSCGAMNVSLPLFKKTPSFGTLPPTQNTPTPLCNKVRFYWEGNYDLYSYNFGSKLANTKNYLTGLFNIIAALYQNEGITVELSELYIWTSADPYGNESASTSLNNFKAHWNTLGDSFNGDIAHLLGGGSTNNGGIAFILPELCFNRSYTYGYTNVWGYYNALPAYSWDVNAVTHEIGHNLGSYHTQWCGWNTGPSGTCGAIDNCAGFDPGSNCNTCPSTYTTVSPGWQGTIMSYCHLVNGIGVNLSNGFGPLPQALIRDVISSSFCVGKINQWTGAISTAWEETGNWNCGTLPDANTDVVIPGSLTNYPVINSPAISKSVKQAPGSSIKINPGFTLIMAGEPNH